MALFLLVGNSEPLGLGPRPAQGGPYPAARLTASAATLEERVERLEKQIEQIRGVLKIPGLSAIVLQDQRVLWRQGFGYADLQAKRPYTANTPQPVASLTKTLAATLLMQLVEREELKLDEPMSLYSDEFKDSPVQIKHLLSHTSEGNPGDNYRYNGALYNHLTAVLEKKTGKPFRELLVETFLGPLEMENSAPGADVANDRARWQGVFGEERFGKYESVLRKMPKAYRLYGDEIVEAPHPPDGLGASAGLISTVEDMAKFDMAIDRHRFLQTTTQEKAWTPFPSNRGKPLPHGLGWFAQSFEGHRLIWHYGHWPRSFSATYLKVPEKKLTFLLLANSDAASAPFYRSGGIETSAFACTFLRLFVFEPQFGHSLPDPDWTLNETQFKEQLGRMSKGTGYKYECERQSHAAVRTWLNEWRQSAQRVVRIDPSTLPHYEGSYRLSERRVFKVTLVNERLYIDAPRNFQSELFPLGNDHFFFKSIDATLNFDRDPSGKIKQLILRTGNQELTATRVDEIPQN